LAWCGVYAYCAVPPPAPVAPLVVELHEGQAGEWAGGAAVHLTQFPACVLECAGHTYVREANVIVICSYRVHKSFSFKAWRHSQPLGPGPT